jgi:hypothetical protein
MTTTRTHAQAAAFAIGAMACVLSARPSVVLAQDRAEPIRLDYRASSGCPDEAGFLARIRARTVQARAALPGEPARTFIVTLETGASPWGQVGVVGADGPQHPRRVEAGTCGEVADALALVVALAVDPRSLPGSAEAAGGDQPQTTATAAPTPAATATAEPPVPPVPPPQQAALRPTRPAEAEPRPPVTPVERPSPTVSSGVGALSIGADVSMSTGASPNVLASVSPFVGLRTRTRSVFEPSARLAFFRAGTPPLAAAGADAAFTWTVGRVDLCPFDLGRSAIQVATCVRAEAGELDVAASHITPALTKRRVWFAAGPLVRAEWSFYRWGFLDLELGALFRVTNDRFYFVPDSPSSTVYQVPLVGVSAGTGLGVRFL